LIHTFGVDSEGRIVAPIVGLEDAAGRIAVMGNRIPPIQEPRVLWIFGGGYGDSELGQVVSR